MTLKKNYFREVPVKTFEYLPHLNDLNLEQNNDITSLNGQPFINLKKLTKLNLKRCQIRDPIEPYAFQGLDLLRNLDLSENNINAFPKDALKSLGTLETLEIGLNNIKTLTFLDMHSLKDLTNFSITGCRNEFSLENADVFRNNANLHEINITRCSQFTHLPPEIFTNLPHLKKLNFHQSGLTHISQDVADWSALEYFDFSNNPLKCDCDLVWLNKILITKSSRLLFQQLPKVICKFPQTSDEYVLPQQNNEKMRDLFCEDSGLSGLAITLIVIACILVIVLVSGLVYWYFYGGITCDNSSGFVGVKRRRRKIKRPKKLSSKQDIGGNQVKCGVFKYLYIVPLSFCIKIL